MGAGTERQQESCKCGVRRWSSPLMSGCVPERPHDEDALPKLLSKQQKNSVSPFAAIATDMDGTILNRNHHLSELTKSTLYELSLLGVHIIIATGRHYMSVTSINKDLLQYFGNRALERGAADFLGVDKGFYLITSNGARVHNPAGELIFARDLDSGVVWTLYERFGLRDNGDAPHNVVAVSAYQTDTWWLNRTFMSEEMMMQKFGMIPDVWPDVLRDFPTTGVGKVSFRCDNAELLNQYEREINEMFSGCVEAVMSSDKCLDVMAAGVSKATALQEVGKILNFDSKNDVIAFGDSMNDRDMLAIAAKGCVMKNGQMRLKELLPYAETIGSNDEDAVAFKLRDVFCIGD